MWHYVSFVLTYSATVYVIVLTDGQTKSYKRHRYLSFILKHLYQSILMSEIVNSYTQIVKAMKNVIFMLVKEWLIERHHKLKNIIFVASLQWNSLVFFKILLLVLILMVFHYFFMSIYCMQSNIYVHVAMDSYFWLVYSSRRGFAFYSLVHASPHSTRFHIDSNQKFSMWCVVFCAWVRKFVSSKSEMLLS